MGIKKLFNKAKKSITKAANVDNYCKKKEKKVTVEKVKALLTAEQAAYDSQARSCKIIKDQLEKEIKLKDTAIEKWKYDENPLEPSSIQGQLNTCRIDNIDCSNLVQTGLNEINFINTANDAYKIRQQQIYDISNAILQQQIYEEELNSNINVLLNFERGANSVGNYMNKNNPVIKNDLISEKIEYRELEHQKLVNLNKTIDLLFYCILVAVFIVMVITNNFKFKEHFLIYLFVFLIPFLFPYLYKMCKYFYNSLQTNSSGPKNAFIDNNNDPFIKAYNV